MGSGGRIGRCTDRTVYSDASSALCSGGRCCNISPSRGTCRLLLDFVLLLLRQVVVAVVEVEAVVAHFLVEKMKLKVEVEEEGDEKEKGCWDDWERN